MGRPLNLAAAITAAALLTACSGTPQMTTAPAPAPTVAGTPAPTPPATTPGATATEPALAPDGRPFVVDELATFGEPWAMAVLPGTPWLAVTERSGSLWLHQLDTADRVEVAGVPEVVASGQGGLGDIVPGPDYANDHTVYLSWAEAGEGGSGAVVGRATLDADASTPTLEGLEVIWRQTPKTTGNGHFAHRIAVSPDGQHLFVTSGDRQKLDPAQDLSNTLGTIVRLNLDGTPASGNPFADRGSPSDEIWSYGHRNPLGIAFDADGNLWSSEMGPAGGDELNLIVEGGNYGWPEASNGSHYGGGDIPDHADGDGFEAPQAWWTPSISPGSLLIYSGDAFPQWQGDAFLGALSGRALVRVTLDGTSAGEGEQWDMGQRIRGLAQAPDGSILVLEDRPGGRLLQLTAP